THTPASASWSASKDSLSRSSLILGFCGNARRCQWPGVDPFGQSADVVLVHEVQLAVGVPPWQRRRKQRRQQGYSSTCVPIVRRHPNVTIPLQNCVRPPVSTSYLRTNASLPSPPTR